MLNLSERLALSPAKFSVSDVAQVCEYLYNTVYILHRRDDTLKVMKKRSVKKKGFDEKMNLGVDDTPKIKV